MIKFFNSKKKLAYGILIVVTLVAAAIIIGYLAKSGKLKFQAAGETTISNKATVTFQDASLNTYTVESNTVTTTITDATFNLNLSFQAQGLAQPGNYSKTASLVIYATTPNPWTSIKPAGDPAAPLYRKDDIAVQTNNNTTFTGSISGVTWPGATIGSTYQFHLKINNYLYSGYTAALENGMTITLANQLRGGNFLSSDNDLSINTGDGATITYPTYTTANTTLDLNGDGYILGEEYAIMNSNWSQSGN